MGDFNIDLLKHDSNSHSQVFLSTLLSSGFYPKIDRPTRITETSSTIIDNIITNNHDNRIKSGVWLTDISDHLPVFAVLPMMNNSRMNSSKYCVITKRCYTTDSMVKFKEELKLADWSTVFAFENTVDKYDCFTRTIELMHDKYFPLTTTKIKNNRLRKPWITSGILKSIKRKNSLYKTAVKNKSGAALTKYRAYKNKLTLLLRSSEKNYYSSKLLEVRDSSSKTWKLLNQMTSRSGSTKNSVTQIIDNDIVIDNPATIAEKFNRFFSNIGPDLAKIIPTSNKKPTTYLRGEYPQSMFFLPAIDCEINDIIGNLKNSNSKGPDNLPVSLIKFCSAELNSILTHLINTSLTEGCFPDSLKVAKIIPVHKAGDSKCVANYRPISVLSVISKIFEKVVCCRLNNYITENAILHENQYGFRPKLSTTLALLHLVDGLSQSIDDGKITAGVFIDLAKAFDTVDHAILLSKLEFYGIRGVTLRWFESYLLGRKQFVAINKTHSDLANIRCGVPQGSILGPILFILYINDFNYLSNVLQIIMFADDTNLFLTGSDLLEIELVFNRELKIIAEWFQSIRLSLNVTKTSYLIFSNKRDIQLNLMISNSLLTKQHDTKFLGVYISSNLSWNKHIDLVVNKISKNVGIIAKVRHILPVSNTRTLYLTLVEPYLSYCNIIWAHDSNTVRLDKIFKIQKRYVRMMTFSDFRAHSGPLFKQLSIMSVYDLYKYQLAIFMFKNANGMIPATHRFKFELNSDLHDYNTRNKSNYHMFHCRTKCRQNIALELGLRLWNSLPHQIISIPLLIPFKRSIRAFILN